MVDLRPARIVLVAGLANSFAQEVIRSLSKASEVQRQPDTIADAFLARPTRRAASSSVPETRTGNRARRRDLRGND